MIYVNVAKYIYITSTKLVFVKTLYTPIYFVYFAQKKQRIQSQLRTTLSLFHKTKQPLNPSFYLPDTRHKLLKPQEYMVLP